MRQGNRSNPSLNSSFYVNYRATSALSTMVFSFPLFNLQAKSRAEAARENAEKTASSQKDGAVAPKNNAPGTSKEGDKPAEKEEKKEEKPKEKPAKVPTGLRAKLLKAGNKPSKAAAAATQAAELEKKRKAEEEARRKKKEEEELRRRKEEEERKRKEEEERRRKEEGEMGVPDHLRKEGLDPTAAELPDVRLQLEWA